MEGMQLSKEISKEEVHKTQQIIKKPDPKVRIEAVDFISDLYCILCAYKSECSSKYTKHLLKCRYLEDWVLSRYREAVSKS